MKKDSENIKLIPLEGVKHKMTNEELKMLMEIAIKEIEQLKKVCASKEKKKKKNIENI